MTIRKSIDFFAPYIASTFNTKDNALFGVSGLVSGGAVTSTGATTVSIEPYTFVQNGLIVEQTDKTNPVTVPVIDDTYFEDTIYIIVSSPDEKSSSGITMTVVSSLSGIGPSTVVLASRIQSVWINPPYLSVDALRGQVLDNRIESIPGRVSGLLSKFGLGFGINQGLRFAPGTASEPDGSKRVFPIKMGFPYGSPEDGQAFDISIKNVDPDFHRTDYVVLRKRKNLKQLAASVEFAKGGTLLQGSAPSKVVPAPTASRTVDSSVGNGVPAEVTLPDGRHIVVWTNANVLHLAQVNHNPTRTIGSTSTLTLTAAVTRPIIKRKPGYVYSSDRLHGVASTGTSGSEDIYVFRTDNVASALVSGSIVTSMVNAALRPDMVIDENGYGHIVFQHNESTSGSPNNQIYYMKVDLNDAGFGTVLVTPRFARGSNSGLNDTAPRIVQDSSGHLHVTYVRGSGSNTYGDIYLLELDELGVPTGSDIVVSSNSGSEGTSIGPFSDCTNARIAITPHDTVYVAFLADSAQRIFLYESTFLDRTGFTCGEVGSPNPMWVSPTIYWMDLACDDLGRVIICQSVEDMFAFTIGYIFYKINTLVYSNNVTMSQDLLVNGLMPGGLGLNSDAGRMRLDEDGSISVVSLDAAANIYHEKFSSGPDTELVFNPQDVPISTVCIPASTANYILQVSSTVTHPAKSKVSGYPVIAGHEGDYTGFYSIHQAVASLKGIGGKVYVRGGYHILHEEVRPTSGIEIIADGRVTLDCRGGTAFYTTANYSHITLTDASKNLWNLTDYIDWAGVRPGDIVFAYDNNPPFPKRLVDMEGPFRITQVYYGTSLYPHHVVLDSNPTLSGFTDPHVIVYKTGIGIKGFNIKASQHSMFFTGTAFLKVEDVSVEGVSSTGIITNTNYELTFQNVNAGSSGYALETSYAGFGSPIIKEIGYTVENCKFRGAASSSTNYVCFSELERLTCNNNYNSGRWYFPDAVVSGDTAPIWVSNAGEVFPIGYFDSSSYLYPWANDSTAYIHKLRLGSYPSSSIENLINAQAHFMSIMPGDIDQGLMLSGQGKSNEYGIGGGVARITGKNYNVSHTIEPNGRLAHPHKFEDDFHYIYRGSSSDIWMFAGSEQVSKMPLFYQAQSYGYTIGCTILQANDFRAPIHPAMENGTLGIINSTAGFPSQILMKGADCWRVQNASSRIAFVARLCFASYAGLPEDLLQRQLMIGLSFFGTIDNPNKSIVFTYDATTAASTWKATYWDWIDGPVYNYSYTFSDAPSLDTYQNLYIFVSKYELAWAIGNSLHTLSLSAPYTINSGDIYAPWVTTTCYGAAVAPKYSFLDYWEVSDMKAISG